MKISTTKFLKACSLTIVLLGSAAVVMTVSTPDMAYAKNGNDNGGGNGNGGGNSAKSERSTKKSEGSTQTKAKEKAEKSKPAAKVKKKDAADELGVSASELGALNAAHANANALKNASPNSRVGRIAAYRDAVLAGEVLAEELAAKQEQLDALDEPTRTVEEIDTEISGLNDTITTKNNQITELEAMLTDPEADVDAIQTDIDTLKGEVTQAEADKTALEDEKADAIAYETLSNEVEELVVKVEEQTDAERALLEAAANKEVTDEVEAAIKKLLGL